MRLEKPVLSLRTGVLTLSRSCVGAVHGTYILNAEVRRAQDSEGPIRARHPGRWFTRAHCTAHAAACRWRPISEQSALRVRPQLAGAQALLLWSLRAPPARTFDCADFVLATLCTYGYVHACILWVLHGYGMPIYDHSLSSSTQCNALVCSAAHKSSVLDLVKYSDPT